MLTKSNYLNYKQTAEWLGVPLSTLYGWVHFKQIPHIRLGPRMVRFDCSVLQHWLDDRAVEVVEHNPLFKGMSKYPHTKILISGLKPKRLRVQ